MHSLDFGLYGGNTVLYLSEKVKDRVGRIKKIVWTVLLE